VTVRDNWLKAGIRRLFFPSGALRRIRFGPLHGMVFRVSPVTGLAPWYSGAERKHQNEFRSLVRPGGVAVDVGANWGLHSLYLSRLVGKDGLVIAVEPFPPAFRELQWHLGANECFNVRALPVALSDRDGKSSFLPGESSSAGRLGDEPTEAAADTATVVVTRTLDAVVEEAGLTRLDLVKIDVEGAEGRVLRGAERAAARFRPALVIDLHTPEQDVEVARGLTEHGYLLRRLSPPPILRTDVGWPDPTGVWGSILATAS
jgi:FkbM family methyltransferase